MTLLLLTAATMSCAGGEELDLGPRQIPTGVANGGSLMRLPVDGGSAQLYRPDSLTALDWRVPSGVPAFTRALGTDLDDRMVYGVNSRGEVIGIDLISRKPRPYLARTGKLSGSADGVVLGIDSAGRPVRFVSRTLTTYRGTVVGGEQAQLVRARGRLLASYSAADGLIQVFEEKGEVRRIEAPAGHLASSWFGDLLMVTSENGVTLVDPTSDAAPDFIALPGLPLTGVFSPSAHRLYISRARGDIVLIDRFTNRSGLHREIGQIQLPGSATALRPDRSGRWLLARPESGDSVWLVDLVRQELVATIATTWAEDLPLVTGGRTLTVRDGSDVVGHDIGRGQPLEFARLSGGASDIYLAVPWVPTGNQFRPTSTLAPTIATRLIGAPPGQLDSTLADTADTQADSVAPGAVQIFIQVTSTQNEPYARTLAEQLSLMGFRSAVLDPDEVNDAFRVVVGPYSSRDEADADGKRLGRPYFVTTPGSEDN